MCTWPLKESAEPVRLEVRGAESILSLPNFVWIFAPRSIACAGVLHKGKLLVVYIIDVGGGGGGGLWWGFYV